MLVQSLSHGPGGRRQPFVLKAGPDSSQKLTTHFVSARFEDLSPEVVEAVKMTVLDTAGAALAGSSSAGVNRAKMAIGLEDGCWTGASAPFTFTAEMQIFGGTNSSFCNTQLPGFPFPRYVAGAPLEIDVMKCQLRAIKPTDYVEAFTPAEMTRLRAIFPTGVCDWSKPGVAQTDPISTWITYTGVGTYNRDNK